MTGTTSGPLSSSSIVIFDSSSASSNTFHSKHPIIISWRDGPQKLTGHVKRGRPGKERQLSRFGKCDEESPTNESSSSSKFSFVTYTSSPQNASLNMQRLVRRRAMLDYRRRERERKSASEEAEKFQTSRSADDISLGAKKKNSDEILWHSVANKCMNVPASTAPADLLPKEITGVEPFNAFPIKIEPYMLELLTSYTTTIYATMYTLESHVHLNPPKDYWLPTALQDAALLHAFLFCADVHGSLSQRRNEGPAAVTHLSSAIQIVNERLRAPAPRITDATIAVVCTFAHTEMLNGNYSNWKVHMRGLKQMLRHRGGIQALESNRLLRNKLHRADLCGSLHAVSTPYFTSPSAFIPIPRPAPHHYQTPATGFTKIINTIPLNEQLIQILHQIQAITINLNIFYNQHPQHPKTSTRIHPLHIREAITSTQYALLSLPFQQPHQHPQPQAHPQPPTTAPSTPLPEILRLSLLLYLSTLLSSPSPPPAFTSASSAVHDPLCTQLKTLYQSHINTPIYQDPLPPLFSLWITLLSASSTQHCPTRTAFLSFASRVTAGESWDEIENRLRSFFWVEKIHRGLFRGVWEEVGVVEGKGLGAVDV